MSSRPRVYVGRLSHRARESDVDRFFRGFGKVRDIMLKNGFGFVEFDDIRDAEDAIHDLNGRELCGERVLLEIARGIPRGAGGAFISGYVPPQSSSRHTYSRESKRDTRSSRSRDMSGYGRPSENGYRLIVENLSTRVSWQDLKDMMRPHGDILFADAHHYRKNEGVVEFASRSDLKRAVEKMDGKEFNGKRIRLVPDYPKSHSRSHSRSRSGSREGSYDRKKKRSHSRSQSAENQNKRSRSRSRSGGSDKGSVSPDKNGRSRSRSASPPRKRSSSVKLDREEPSAPDDVNEEQSPAGSYRSRSRTGSPDHKSNSRSRSPE